MNSLPCFLVDKIEGNQGDRTLETIRDLDIWFDQNVYTTVLGSSSWNATPIQVRV